MAVARKINLLVSNSQSASNSQRASNSQQLVILKRKSDAFREKMFIFLPVSLGVVLKLNRAWF